LVSKGENARVQLRKESSGICAKEPTVKLRVIINNLIHPKKPKKNEKENVAVFNFLPDGLRP
jgi:hypothetical protein